MESYPFIDICLFKLYIDFHEKFLSFASCQPRLCQEPCRLRSYGGAFVGRGVYDTARPDNADIIIVNTCAFITPAKEESIEEIFRLAKWEQHGSCSHLIVTGCLPQRYGNDLAREIPSGPLPGHCRGSEYRPAYKGHRRGTFVRIKACRRHPLFSHGLKLAASVDNAPVLCLFENCRRVFQPMLILRHPSIRGPFRSRHHDDLLKEAAGLATKVYGN